MDEIENCPTIKEIEDYSEKYYKQNYKKEITKIKGEELAPGLKGEDGKYYNVDMLKIVMLSNITNFKLNKAEVRPSNIHGRGLFANVNIKKHELITFYPGDIIEYIPNKDRYSKHISIFYTSIRTGDTFGSDSFKNRNPDYQFDVNEQYSIYGNPFFDKDPNFLGHFINDGAKTNGSEISNKLYLNISFLKANCDFYVIKELLVAIVATKDINKDDELFINYGIIYWDFFNKRNNI